MCPPTVHEIKNEKKKIKEKKEKRRRRKELDMGIFVH